MATAIQLAGLLALCLGAATVAFGLLGVVVAAGVLAIGLGASMFAVGTVLEREEETE